MIDPTTLSPTGELRALYVEDNALDADLARRALRRAQPAIELDVAETVADALTQLDAQPTRYTWVLFDLTLPDGDGLQVLKHVRARRLNITAVAVTGTGDERAVVQALKTGVDDYVIKQGDYLDRLPEILLQARQRLLDADQARAEHTLRVLYIEDNPQDGELTLRHLHTHAPQLQVSLAHAPFLDLEDRLARGEFDLLLLDYHLDDLDAFELLKRIHRSHRHDLPVVIVTGQGSEEVAVQALRLGVADYLVKDPGYLLRLPAVIESAYVRTQLMREREHLRASEAQLLALTRQVPGAIVVARLKPDGHIDPLYATEALGQVQFLSLSDLRDGVMQSRIHPEDRGRIRRAVTLTARDMSIQSCEYRLHIPGKGWCWFETQMSPQPQEDGDILLYSYTFDITERKAYAAMALAAQTADQANHAKTEFLSRMSHELRTPLNAVIGFAQLLRTDPKENISANQRRQIQFIEQAGRHLVDMISDILDLSRIEAGQLPLSPALVHAHQLCADAMAFVEPAARQQGIAIQMAEVPTTSSAIVTADPVRLRQVMINLLSNAIKYNKPQGQVGIQFDARTDGQLAITVSDSGLGLSPDQQRHLFEPFNRLGAERTQIEGTGIGLAIVRKLLVLMGGDIQVQSDVGIGSRFTVLLPLASDASSGRNSDASSISSPSSARADQASGSLGVILYAEDDAINAELMRQVLGMHLPGLRLEIAISGRQAVRQAVANPPDLILLDMHLGDMDAVAVLQAMHQDARLRRVPCLVLSADALPDHVHQAMGHGFADYLTKPLDVQALLASIQKHLDGKRPV